VRNIRPGFNKGLWLGLANAGWETVTQGLSPWTLKNHADWSSLHKLDAAEAAQHPGPNAPRPSSPRTSNARSRRATGSPASISPRPSMTRISRST
jgi:hypothetical protein